MDTPCEDIPGRNIRDLAEQPCPPPDNSWLAIDNDDWPDMRKIAADCFFSCDHVKDCLSDWFNLAEDSVDVLFDLFAAGTITAGGGAIEGPSGANLVIHAQFSIELTSALQRIILTAGTAINLQTISEFADNAAALGGGLTAGDLYRTGDFLKVVH